MSVSLLWQIGDMLRRSPWTGEQFRFRHFIESFEKLQFKVILYFFYLKNEHMNWGILLFSFAFHNL